MKRGRNATTESDAGSSDAGSDRRSEWSGRSMHTTASEISVVNREMQQKSEMIKKQAESGTLCHHPGASSYPVSSLLH